MAPSVTAFVLGGASNLGAVQVGMLLALLERGVVPDLVVGCSAGALNGAAVAHEPTLQGVRRLEGLWLSLTRTDVWPAGSLRSAVRLLRKGQAVNGGEGLRRVIESHVPSSTTFADLAVPFACVASSLDTGLERWFTEGSLPDAVMASSALPAVLPPVEVDGELLVDGAMVNVVPMVKALEMGATRLFVLQVKDLDVTPARPARPLEVLVRSMALARNARFIHELARVPAEVERHILPVPPWPRLRYDGFSRTPELVAQARATAGRYLDGVGAGGRGAGA